MSSQQLWVVNSLGGYLGNDTLSEQLRYVAQPIMQFRMFVKAEPKIAKRSGEKVLFDKISNISTSGGTVAETSTIQKRSFNIVQGSLTVYEYANALAYTEKLMSIAQINVDAATRQKLGHDMAKTLDSAAFAQYKATKWKAVVTATNAVTLTTNGTAGAKMTGLLSDKTARDIVDAMKKANVPRVDNQGNFIAICSTQALRGLYDYFEAKIQYTEKAPMVKGEVGTYYGTRFVEETNVLSNTLGKSSTSGEAVFFGGDAVIEGIVTPEEIRIDLPKDFGRDRGIAWYYFGGFQKIWDYTNDSESHIIHLTST